VIEPFPQPAIGARQVSLIRPDTRWEGSGTVPGAFFLSCSRVEIGWRLQTTARARKL